MTMNSSCQETPGNTGLGANSCENAVATLGKKSRRYRPPPRKQEEGKAALQDAMVWKKPTALAVSPQEAAHLHLLWFCGMKRPSQPTREEK